MILSRTVIKRVVASVFLTLAPFWSAKASDAEEANRLFVAAVNAWDKADQISGHALEASESRFFLLDEANNNLNRIVVGYPGADLAIKLLIGEEIGPLSRMKVRQVRNDAAKGVARELANCDIPAECVFRHALQTARLLDEGFWRVSSFANIAIAEVNIGAFEEALKAIEQDDTIFGRDAFLQRFAYAQIDLEDFSGAQATAKKIDSAKRRGYVVNRLASKLADLGQFAAAQEQESVGRAIDAHYDHDELLAGIAIPQALAGMNSESTLTLSKMTFQFNRDEALTKISIAQAKTGQRREAEDTIRGIEGSGQVVEALARIAVALREPSLLTSALEIANGIDYENGRDRALHEVSAGQADVGNFEKALDTLNDIQLVGWRDDSFERIAVAQAKNRLFSDAFGTVKRIDSPYKVDDALVQISGLLADAGRYLEAQDTVRDIQSEWARQDAVINIVSSMARSGYFAEAIAVAQKGDESLLIGAFYEIVKAQIEANQIEQSIDTILKLEKGVDRVGLLGTIAASISK